MNPRVINEFEFNLVKKYAQNFDQLENSSEKKTLKKQLDDLLDPNGKLISEEELYSSKYVKKIHQFVCDRFFYAIQESKLDELNQFGENISNYINITNDTYMAYSPLYFAMFSPNAEICQLLIESKADIYFKFGNYSILDLIMHFKCQSDEDKKNQIKIVQLLLQKDQNNRERGIDSYLNNYSNNNFDSPFSKSELSFYLREYAKKSNCIDMIALLYQYGANINEQDNYGNTALHYACAEINNEESVQLLLALGADTNTINDDDLSPIAFLQHYRKHPILHRPRHTYDDYLTSSAKYFTLLAFSKNSYDGNSIILLSNNVYNLLLQNKLLDTCKKRNVILCFNVDGKNQYQIDYHQLTEKEKLSLKKKIVDDYHDNFKNMNFYELLSALYDFKQDKMNFLRLERKISLFDYGDTDSYICVMIFGQNLLLKESDKDNHHQLIFSTEHIRKLKNIFEKNYISSLHNLETYLSNCHIVHENANDPVSYILRYTPKLHEAIPTNGLLPLLNLHAEAYNRAKVGEANDSYESIHRFYFNNL